MRFKLIDNFKNCWKMYSVWVFALIAASPEIYNAIVMMGWADEAPMAFVWTIRILAVVGIVSRLVKQQKLEIK